MQVIALKLRFPDLTQGQESMYDYPTMINRHLPPDIRVIGYQIVNNSFNARYAKDIIIYFLHLLTLFFKDLELILDTINTILYRTDLTMCRL